MPASPDTPTIARLADSAAVSFGPLSHYQPLIRGDGGPVFTGVQTCAPGYRTPMHRHPYVECLFVIEGTLHAWMEGREDEFLVLCAGDMISLPAGRAHAFGNRGPGTLRILGIHNSPERIVDVVEQAPEGGAAGPAVWPGAQKL
ncbi:RmlC-like cupin domain-containing protein [Hyaloraphidium curvatum]|nr:RmlC-like cupin domain-containing protein [Hyaloraphidium curvatum]